MYELVACDRCHRLVRADTAHMEAPLTLCAACIRAHYTHCVGCGCFAERELLIYLGNGDDGYCDECYARYLHRNLPK